MTHNTRANIFFSSSSFLTDTMLTWTTTAIANRKYLIKTRSDTHRWLFNEPRSCLPPLYILLCIKDSASSERHGKFCSLEIRDISFSLLGNLWKQLVLMSITGIKMICTGGRWFLLYFFLSAMTILACSVCNNSCAMDWKISSEGYRGIDRVILPGYTVDWI